MTAAPTPSLPGPRTLLGWWRELEPVRPRRLWFCPLLLHRLDALVETAQPTPLDPLVRGLLRHLSAGSSPATLHMGHDLLCRLLDELETAGLIERRGAGPAVTETGRTAAAKGAYLTRSHERRSFYFVDNACLARPAYFIHLNRPPGGPAPVVADWRFDASLLAECARRPPEWKARHQFPTDILEVFVPGAEQGGKPPAWRRVPIDHAEQALLVLALAPADGDGVALHGFTVRTENWSLFREAPLLTVAQGWEEVFPELAAEPPPAEWRQAWLQWCQPRGVPEAEAETCQVEPRGDRLHIRAPKAVTDRLRAARGDPLKHEACLMVGAVRARMLARLEVETIG
jgi:hypothetical protein